jgi:hypothetical protein
MARDRHAMRAIDEKLQGRWAFLLALLAVAAVTGGRLFYLGKHKPGVALVWCFLFIFGGGMGVTLIPGSRVGEVLAVGRFFGTMIPALGWPYGVVR